MRVIVCGGGQVGFGIAERLAAEQHDVCVIDSSARAIAAVRDHLDVRTVLGNGAHPDVLVQAGASETDMMIAVTLSDEVNIVACNVAHSLFKVPTKVARIRAQSYLKGEWRDLFSRNNLPIDVIISPELEVGEMVLRRLAYPGAFDVVPFADGSIAAVGILCAEDCPVVDTPLKQLSELFPDLGAVIVGIQREGRMFAPKVGDVMLVGDRVYAVSAKDSIRRLLKLFGRDEPEASRVVIAGGGNIGFHVAQALEARHNRISVKIIEGSRERATSIADDLKRVAVLNGSALDEELLREAGIAETDTVIALTNNDEVNVLACVMARTQGAKRSMALINNPSYQPLARALGIDAYVNPRAVTVSKILRHIRRGRIRGVYTLQNGAAEIIEAEALETSLLVGKALRDLDLPDGIRIGAIWRKGRIITPDGETRIEARDRVVIFAVAARVKQVEQMFRVSLEFF